MATVTKDFRIKSGLVVEGTTGTINASDIITEDAITGGTQTNITVTYDPQTKLVNFAAENGVADSTTSDLAEGTNLYFTNQRAIDAVGGSASSENTPNSVVKRDGNGDFAAGTISATLAGDVSKSGDVTITSTNNDIILDADGNVYLGSAVAGSRVATYDRVDAIVGDVTVDGSTGNTITDRIATAVSGLVDGAPALLNTLNELAAAINDDEGFSSTITTAIGEKVAKSGDTMTGALILSGDPTLDLHAATKQYVDAAGTSANSYIDDLIGDATVDGTAGETITDRIATAKSEAITDAQTYADALTTADIEEDPAGTGTSGTLYFTDARAVTALEAVVPNFEEVRIDSIAKQVAAQVSATTAGSPVTAYAFAKADYRSAKFLVKVAYSTHTEVSEVLLTLDTSDNIAITEYAVVGTNGSSSAISADIDGTDVRLRVTPVNASSTVTVMGTLLV